MSQVPKELRVLVKKSFKLMDAMDNEETNIIIPIGTKGFALQHLCDVPEKSNQKNQ